MMTYVASGPTSITASARHICEEARVVLTSLRGGPPAVARGELAQDMMDLRAIVKAHLELKVVPPSTRTPTATDSPMPSSETVGEREMPLAPLESLDSHRNATPPPQSMMNDEATRASTTTTAGSEDEDGVLVQRPIEESPMPQSKICNFTPQKDTGDFFAFGANGMNQAEDVGPFARPFLAVIMDPRAAGPHTLMALRALFRLLERGSLQNDTRTVHMTDKPVQPTQPHSFPALLEPLMRGVLACKFEQTDAGADEAVEMAIADLLALLVNLDPVAFLPATLMEAFNTVFVTRNTFVHSPALCYHFEDVLTSIVKAVFADILIAEQSAKLMLEFLVNQLLHTPLTGGEALDEAAREAQMAHDATRVLCLRLTRSCVRAGWSTQNKTPTEKSALPTINLKEGGDESVQFEDRSLIQIIQDDLCLSLLMTGQAIWAYVPGFLSIEVLSEICATLSTLWNTVPLRQHLVCQFETIFTGLYQRALVLLRKRPNPTDSVMFNENLVFDAELEVILESLVDILCIHENKVVTSNESSLECLYATFDCHLSRSDVAEGLMTELCRSCGAIVDKDGNAMLVPGPLDPETHNAAWRPVPPHLKELCAEALLGGMKCLFREDQVDESANDLTKRRVDAKESDDPHELDMMAPIDHAGRTSISHSSEDAGHLSHRAIKSKKRLMRKAAKLFNEKATKGIDFLVKSGLIPEPVTPKSVASFLRNGLVVGLDKVAVGQYLGELGKPAIAGKSPPSWQRDWFHKECLESYCDLFKFEGQSLLDGLRMFLAAFRLPGESQQIDRIIQAFADSCGKVCDENIRLKLFSDDPKRASDAAFLLAFSIIMLNTDRHNPRIREDKKMSVAAFIRNNTDYGRDITEKGKEFPPDFLTGIYESISEEEIRTEAEGSEGAMTVERWRDVIRLTDDSSALASIPETHDSNDLKELVVENLWMPILSSIGAFWGYVHSEDSPEDAMAVESAQSGMLGAQGARLGMDIAIAMLTGVRNIGRVDLFREIFVCVCGYTGLIGDFQADAVQRTSAFVSSVEAQSAVIVALRAASDAGDEIGVHGWKRLWGVIFELRDLDLLGGGRMNGRHGLLSESEADLLTENARRDWSMMLAKGDIRERERVNGQETSFFGAMGRALFGSVEDVPTQVQAEENAENEPEVVKTIHGKEELMLWNELAASDDEDDETDENDRSVSFEKPVTTNPFASAGTNFESQLIHEDILIQHHTDTPVTGLERVDDSLPFQISPRARVRKRLAMSCDFSGLVSESRFLDLAGVKNLVSALVEIIDDAASGFNGTTEIDEDEPFKFPVSPASEALAEVVLCEIAIRNRDRLSFLWHSVLKDHYQKRLAALASTGDDPKLMLKPGTEKCITGLLRVAACAVQRDDVASEVVSSLDMLYTGRPLEGYEKHLGEGLWRICRNVDGLAKLEAAGWKGLIGLIEWCAARGGITNGYAQGSGLAEDDPSLQAYRVLHLVLHAPELQFNTPYSATIAIRSLIIAGERGHCSKLCLAGLDLLYVLHARLRLDADRKSTSDMEPDALLKEYWIPVVECIAEAAEHSSDPGVRQHALSVLTDVFLDKQTTPLTSSLLARVLPEVCIPLAGKRIAVLLLDESRMLSFTEEIMIEFEQCTSLIYKPFLNHLGKLIESPNDLVSVWTAILAVMGKFLNEPLMDSTEGVEVSPTQLRNTLKGLASEHLRNAIMVLVSMKVLAVDGVDGMDKLSSDTWNAVMQMEFCTPAIEEWKAAAVAELKKAESAQIKKQ